ncbi:MAG: biotin--[acetyl-CoA-carboxylase] ligase [Acidimicrobiales bacterium]
MDSRSEDPQARPPTPAASPMPLVERVTALRAGLADTRFAQVDWVAETGSTNRDLLEELRAGAAVSGGAGPAVLITDHQTAGRGTKGRSWFDPPGGSLLMSVRLFPDVAPGQLHLFTMALSLAAAEACFEVAGVDVGLKWPNDLFVADRKLAGVLAESSVRGGRVEALVIGIGMNVNWPTEVPAELADTAVALNQVAGGEVDRVALALASVRGLEAELRLLEGPGGPERLLERCRQRSATLGRRVRVELADGPLVGTAVDIAADGQLVVDINGERRPFAAADITHLRLA